MSGRVPSTLTEVRTLVFASTLARRAGEVEDKLRPEFTLPFRWRFEADEEFDAYAELMTRLAGERVGEDPPMTRVLGHPQPVQGPVEGYVPERYRESPAYADAGPDDWVLLLQIDSDRNTHGICFGDLGRVYFMIHRADLRERRFDRAWYALQCS